MNGSLNTQEEPGSTDNRLSLSPGDYPFVKDWEDGKEYVLKEVHIQQQTTGEFAVTAAEPQEEAPAEETPAEDTGEAVEETPPPGKQGGMTNPAMRRMMASKKY